MRGMSLLIWRRLSAFACLGSPAFARVMEIGDAAIVKQVSPPW